MTPEEITYVLAVAATVDQRAPQPGELVLKVWHEILKDVPVAAAEQAVRTHYRRSRETITPADIIESWKTLRRLEQEERELEAVRELRAKAPQEVRDRGMMRVVGELAAVKALRAGRCHDEAEEARGVAEGELGARRVWAAVRCPWCRAQPGDPCTRPDARERRVRRATPHPARVSAALAGAVIEPRPISHPLG